MRGHGQRPTQAASTLIKVVLCKMLPTSFSLIFPLPAPIQRFYFESFCYSFELHLFIVFGFCFLCSLSFLSAELLLTIRVSRRLLSTFFFFFCICAYVRTLHLLFFLIILQLFNSIFPFNPDSMLCLRGGLGWDVLMCMCSSRGTAEQTRFFLLFLLFVGLLSPSKISIPNDQLKKKQKNQRFDELTEGET